jgi:hypothetical protein
MSDLNDISAKLLANMFRLDEELLHGGSMNYASAKAQSEVSFSKMAKAYRDLMASRPPRKIYFVGPETLRELPDDVRNSPDVMLMPGAYQDMLPKQWKRRKFHPPYRKVMLRPRWVATPKGIFAVDAPRGILSIGAGTGVE